MCTLSFASAQLASVSNGAVLGGTALSHRRRHSQRQSGRVGCRVTVATGSNGNTGPVVIVDNYDSFTYNLSQYLGDLGCEHIVLKNDEKTVDEIRRMKPRGILVSPGPGLCHVCYCRLCSCQPLGAMP